MGVKDYDLNPNNNTQINGINIAEGCPPSGINNAIRQLMADVKEDKTAQDTALQNAIKGNVGSATKLATKRTIDGMQFDGSANIYHYGSCSTAAATVEKAVALAGFVLATGARITVRFTVTNTASSPTLNVNSTGAKPIQYRNAAISPGYLAANHVYEFVYDGAAWELVGDINTDTNTTYKEATTSALGLVKVGTNISVSSGTISVANGSTSAKGVVQLSSATNSTSTTLAATASAVKAAYDKASAAAAFPAGTQMLFVQAAAPTGWTKQTTVNDATIRIVSGTTGGKTGGSVAFSTAFVAGKAITLSGNVGATTLSTAQIPSHTHPANYLTTGNDYDRDQAGYSNNDTGKKWKTVSGAAGSSGSHTHSLSGTATVDLSVKYVDVILCKKA